MDEGFSAEKNISIYLYITLVVHINNNKTVIMHYTGLKVRIVRKYIAEEER